MKSPKTKKIIDLQKTADDTLGIRTPDNSSAVFSMSIESPFDTRSAVEAYEDSKWKMALYFESVKLTYDLKSGNHFIFEDAQKLNESLNPKLFTDDLINIYNTVVIYGHSYTKMTEETGNVFTSLSFAELMKQEFPKARYAVEPFFEQGTVNMVSAPPNTWKSWLLFLCASHIAQGTALLDHFNTEQSKVMIVNEEDSFRSIQDRFRILNVVDTTLPLFFRVANGSKLESKFVDKLLEELKEKQIGVVIFDSLRSMHEADENDSTAMQIILDQMKRIAREGITVIFTHHHRKKGMFEKQSSAESSRGSSAINAAISGHISLDEEEREMGLFLVIRHLKSKAGEKLPAFEVKIIKENNQVKFVYDGEFKQAEKKLGQTKEQLMDVLADNKWKSKKDFEEVITVSKTILHQAIQALKNDGMVLSITRKEAISKAIPVTPKGKSNELYYSLNTESAELVTRNDTAGVQEDFDHFND